MATVLINDEYLNDIADAIREKTHGVATYAPNEMAAAIRDIATDTEETLQIDTLIMQNAAIDYTNDRVTSIAGYTFSNNLFLTGVHFEKVTTIGQYAFQNCSDLEDVDFPNAIEIQPNAFDNCDALVNVIFPKVENVGMYAFKNCSELTKVDLPVAKKLNAQAFSGCAKLTTVILRYNGVTSPESSGSSFPSGIYFYVPSNRVDEYKAHYLWSAIEGRIRAIEDYPDITGLEAE